MTHNANKSTEHKRAFLALKGEWKSDCFTNL